MIDMKIYIITVIYDDKDICNIVGKDKQDVMERGYGDYLECIESSDCYYDNILKPKEFENTLNDVGRIIFKTEEETVHYIYEEIEV